MSSGLLMRRRLSSKMDLRLTQDDGMAVLAMALLVFQGNKRHSGIRPQNVD